MQQQSQVNPKLKKTNKMYKNLVFVKRQYNWGFLFVEDDNLPK
jgi:hypothetical protein